MNRLLLSAVLLLATTLTLASIASAATTHTINFDGGTDSAYTPNATNAPTIGSAGAVEGSGGMLIASGSVGYVNIPATRPFDLQTPTWIRFYVDVTGKQSGYSNHSDVLRWTGDYLRITLHTSGWRPSIIGSGIPATESPDNLTGEHYIEVRITPSSASGVSDGSVTLFVDGVQKAERTGVNISDNWGGGGWDFGLVRRNGMVGDLKIDQLAMTQGETAAPGPYVPPPADDLISDDLTIVSALLQGNTRVTMIGDSITVPSELRRGFWGFIRGIEHANVVGICMGTNTTADNGMVTALPYGGGFQSETVAATWTGGLEVDRAFSSVGNEVYFGLPVLSMREIFQPQGATLGGGGADKLLTRTTMTPAPYAGTATPAWFAEGDRLGCRQLIRAPTTANMSVLYPLVRTRETGKAGGFVSHDLTTDGCRPKRVNSLDPDTASSGTTPDTNQINALWPDLILDGSGTAAAGEFGIEMANAADATGENDGWISIAGNVFYRVGATGSTPEKGLYLTGLADSSYDIVSLAADVESAGATDKRYTVAQLAHWLDVTTIDDTQNNLVILHFAYEPGWTEANLTAALANLRTAFSDAGLKKPHIWVTFSPWVKTVNTIANETSQTSSARAVYTTVTGADRDVSRLDFLQLFGGVSFVANDEYTDAPSSRDLEAENVAYMAGVGMPFTYGTTSVDFTTSATYESAAVLSDGVHPLSPDASAFYWAEAAKRLALYGYSEDITSGSAGTAVVDNAAIATAVRAELATELARIDEPVSTASSIDLTQVNGSGTVGDQLAAIGSDYSAVVTPVQVGSNVALNVRVLRGGEPQSLSGSATVTGDSPDPAVVNVLASADPVSGTEWNPTITGVALTDSDRWDWTVTATVGGQARTLVAPSTVVAATASDVASGGGPISQADAAEPFLSDVSQRSGGVLRGFPHWKIGLSEEPVCGWELDNLGDVRIEAVDVPTTSDATVATVDTTPVTGYGYRGRQPVVRVTPASGASVGATCVIRMRVTLDGGSKITLVNRVVIVAEE